MEEHIIREGTRVVEALEALNRLSGRSMVLFVVGADGTLTGSLTDGDIRRALLAGHGLDDDASLICKHDCLRIEKGARGPEVVAEARRRNISLLPVVENGKIISLFDLSKRKGLLPLEAVLMAGGMGERLRPLTVDIPKPLLPVGGVPIIDHNINLLKAYGITTIYVAVNYLKDKIINHLREKDPEVRIIEEPKRMGTIGALSLVENPSSENLIVMNADLLTDINLEEMYLRHVESGADATMAVVPYSVRVPYAIIESSGTRVRGITEKPTYNYLANAGIYMMRRETLQEIPKGEYTDATDLVESLLSKHRNVAYYTIEGRWLDIGSPDDYRQANS